jgi:iron complex transport system substrate-binding protein
LLKQTIFKFALLFAAVASLHAKAVLASELDVIDDQGQHVRLPHAAQRVISLAPHITELLFAAGGGKKVVGVSSYSDYPAAATLIPQIGDARQLDVERIIALKPDLLVVWASGTPARQQEQLQRLGIPIFYSEPKKLADIPDNVQKLGQLMATGAQAAPLAAQLRLDLATLRDKYQKRSKVTVFYQISDHPLYTLNGQHIVGDALAVCGGQNVFAELPVLAPLVSTEAVLQANPDVILGSETNVAIWKQFPVMQATRRGNLRVISGNLFSRSGPRMVEGVRQLCGILAQVRKQTTP